MSGFRPRHYLTPFKVQDLVAKIIELERATNPRAETIIGEILAVTKTATHMFVHSSRPFEVGLKPFQVRRIIMLSLGRWRVVFCLPSPTPSDDSLLRACIAVWVSP